MFEVFCHMKRHISCVHESNICDNTFTNKLMNVTFVVLVFSQNDDTKRHITSVHEGAKDGRSVRDY